MSAHVANFADILELIDRLPLEEREGLVELVRKRIAEDERLRLGRSIRSARAEHRAGKCKPVTPDELMREILA